MSQKDMYIFVEGQHDEDFVLKIMKPILKRKYREVYPIPIKCPFKEGRKQMDLNKINSFVKSFRNRDDADFIFMIDFDSKNYGTSITINEKKEEVIRTINSLRNKMENILIVIEEIESWYLAGLDKKDLEYFNIKNIIRTENITKEDFISLKPTNLDMLSFRLEVLERFKPIIAIKKNKSFEYFMACGLWC